MEFMGVISKIDVLDILPGVLCLMDDIIVYRKDQQEHKQ